MTQDVSLTTAHYMTNNQGVMYLLSSNYWIIILLRPCIGEFLIPMKFIRKVV